MTATGGERHSIAPATTEKAHSRRLDQGPETDEKTPDIASHDPHPMCLEGYRLTEQALWSGGRATGGDLVHHKEACLVCRCGAASFALARGTDIEAQPRRKAQEREDKRIAAQQAVAATKTCGCTFDRDVWTYCPTHDCGQGCPGCEGMTNLPLPCTVCGRR